MQIILACASLNDNKMFQMLVRASRIPCCAALITFPNFNRISARLRCDVITKPERFDKVVFCSDCSFLQDLNGIKQREIQRRPANTCGAVFAELRSKLPKLRRRYFECNDAYRCGVRSRSRSDSILQNGGATFVACRKILQICSRKTA
jgi:hypothetical protein